MQEFGYCTYEGRDRWEMAINPICAGAEWCDVLIRCYLLPEVLSEVLEEVWSEEGL